MWLWLVLGGLLIAIAWALKFTLNYPILYPIIATAVVVVAVGTIAILRQVLALRAAQKLQGMIEQQGNQQAMNARPERRAEIQELRKQLLGGLSAIKTSKLGRGGKRGGAALYTMPWYMIIGPPGAGKTTALTHSGLVFPYGAGGQGGGGGIRGVGGTRNCDWWFTNEAILLDTAGRYTTESDDRDEWISFLAFLKKYRPKRPINGVIIAISISELIDASESQIEAVGKKLRSRIDEVCGQLSMVLPVYILFTKIDLVAGFSEFFGDLRKSDRSKAWGATIKLELPKNEPGKIFAAEFDVLVKHLHSRGLKRMVMERGRETREKLYQFPIEFAGLKRNLADLIGTTFQPNNISGTPIFRGFYFTSGTQEGRPMDRVLASMSAAMGIRPQQAQQQQQQPVVESKSYFLHDVFMTVIFPDGDIAVRSAVEERRQTIMKVLIAGATFALAAILALPGITSYSNNKALLKETKASAETTAKINWNDDKDPSERLKALKPTLDKLQEQDKFDKEGVPLTLGWGMFVADKLQRPSLSVYASQMVTGFVAPSKRNLEERLNNATGKPFLGDWLALRQYLMLGAIDDKTDHIDVEWATGRYTQLWANLMKKQGSSASEGELKVLARPHVQYYFELLKEGRITPTKLDPDVVSRARAALATASMEDRYYGLLVAWLSDERIDEAGDTANNNLLFPPFELSRAFPNRTIELLRFFQSKDYLDKKGYKIVYGVYTAKGYAAVLKQLEHAEGLLKGESWVLPLNKDENSDYIASVVSTVRDKYEAEYIKQWEDFFADIKVKGPTSPAEAKEIYREISTSPTPLARLILVLDDNTQWRQDNLLDSNENARFHGRIARYKDLIPPKEKFSAFGKRSEKIPKHFESTVAFSRAAGNDIKGYTYAEVIVKDLRDKVIRAIDSRGDAFPLNDLRTDIELARTQASALLVTGCDEVCKKLLTAILLDPLQVGERPTLVAPPTSPVPGVPTKGVPPNITKKLPPNPFPPPGGTR